MIQEAFFPTFIYAEDLNLNTQELANHIIKWSKEEEGIKKTNVKGWHSKTKMHEKPEYKPLVDELFRVIKQVFSEEFLDHEPVLGNMWANINYKGGYNKPHVHPNSVFSGVYYVKTPPGCGNLICNDPRPGIQTCMPTRKKGEPPSYLWREVPVAPQENRIVIFPAWLWHSVNPNESNTERISVSFNFIQRGFE